MFKKIDFLRLSFVLLSAVHVVNAQDNLDALTLFCPESLLENAQEVVLHEERVFVIKSTKHGKFSHKKIVAVLNEKSDANVLQIHYDKESKVGKIKAHLYNANGQFIRKIKSEEIKDYAAISGGSIYPEDRTKWLEIQHSNYPFIVEYEYEQELKGMHFINFPIWHIQGYGSGIKQSAFTIDIPIDQKFSYRNLNIQLQPKETREKQRKIFKWQVENLPAIQKESYSPPSYAVLPKILFAADQFEIEGYKGSMANWKDFGVFIHQLYQGRDKLPETTRQEIQQLTSNAKDDAEKVSILYRYLQDNMRYVSVQLGIGGWQPFDAEYVCENKFGDCKALSNYMKAVLKEVGIKSYPVLIRSGYSDYTIEEDFTYPFFNHVILRVPSLDYWLECTSNDGPVNYLGRGTAGKKVLLITEQGGKIAHTPKLKATQNSLHNQAVITLSPSGSATIQNAAVYTGASQDNLRYRSANYSQSELKEWFLKNTAFSSPKVNKLKVESKTDQPYCSMLYNIEVAHYATKAGKRLFVPINQINAWPSIPSEVKNRQQPVVFKGAFVEEDNIHIHLPEGYQVESLPKKDIEIIRDFGSYQLKFEQKDKAVIISRLLKLNPIQLPAEAYPDFRNFFKEIIKKDKLKMVLVKQKT